MVTVTKTYGYSHNIKGSGFYRSLCRIKDKTTLFCIQRVCSVCDFSHKLSDFDNLWLGLNSGNLCLD